jgi:hypothetical protein
MNRRISLAVGLLLAMPAAGAEDLLAVYERALSNDPQIREADANRRATKEARPQALAALLPQVTGLRREDQGGQLLDRQFPQEIEQPAGSQPRRVQFPAASDSEPRPSAGASICARACSRGRTGSPEARQQAGRAGGGGLRVPPSRT